MKIRNGYVSNSSSSSFLIGYRSLEAVERFSAFEGYDQFHEDAVSEPDGEAVRELLASMAFRELREWKDLFIGRLCGRRDIWNEMRMDHPWSDLCSRFGYRDQEFERRRDRLVIAGGEMEERHAESPLSWNSPELEECRDALNAIIGDTWELADGFLGSKEARGWTLRQTEYGDEGQYGGFMEHGFMPFVERYPGNDLAVVGMSNH